MRHLRVILALFGIISLPYLNTAQASDTETENQPIHVHLVAPSGEINMEVVHVFKTTLEEAGLRVTLPSDIQDTDQAPYGYHAHRDDVRAQNVKEAVESDAHVINLRGGFGSQAVIRALQGQDITPGKPGQIFVGFSDATLLGLYCQHHLGTHFLHGPMYYAMETAKVSGANIGSGTSLSSVVEILTGEKTDLHYRLSPLNQAARETEVSGEILGGNLSVLQRNFSGLLKDLPWDHKILFLEDTGDDVKRTEDILYGLFDTGRLNTIQAIFFGRFPLEHGSAEEFMGRLDDFLTRTLGHSIPLYQNPDFGHGTKNNPLPMGTLATFMPGDMEVVLTVKAFAK